MSGAVWQRVRRRVAEQTVDFSLVMDVETEAEEHHAAFIIVSSVGVVFDKIR